MPGPLLKSQTPSSPPDAPRRLTCAQKQCLSYRTTIGITLSHILMFSLRRDHLGHGHKSTAGYLIRTTLHPPPVKHSGFPYWLNFRHTHTPENALRVTKHQQRPWLQRFSATSCQGAPWQTISSSNKTSGITLSMTRHSAWSLHRRKRSDTSRD